MRLWPRRRWSRVAAIAGIVVVVLIVAVGIDAAEVSARIRHVAIEFPRADEGSTWVLVGSDSRASLPTGPAWYGAESDAPGTHADAVVVLHRDHGHATLLSIPRDVLVSPVRGEISRLTLTLDRGPQALVDGLCRTLNVPATHLVVIDMRAFAAGVDALGGVTISNPTPVRDLESGLDLEHAGRVHVDGLQALALARSRHPQTRTSAGWVEARADAGDRRRTQAVGELLDALASRARHERRNPLALQRTAWALAGGLTTDHGTGLLDLLGFDVNGARHVDVPVRYLDAQGVGATPDDATFQTLEAAGFRKPCQPASG